MKVFIKKRTLNAISKTAAWVESKNTTGSGQLWADKVYDEILEAATESTLFALCRNESLARFGYHCFHIHDWVIAHKVIRNTFIVYRFIHGSRLH